MTEQLINGVAPQRATKGVAIVPIAFERNEGQLEYEFTLRDPAIVRHLEWALKPSPIKGAPTLELLVMFVEVDPEAIARPHRYAILPTGFVLNPSEGFRAKWRASSISFNTGQHAHLFELELDPATLGGALVRFSPTKPEAA